MADRAAPLRLRLPNQLVALETARLAMRAYLADLELPARVIYRLELVLEETLMNRVMHAYPQGGQHLIDVDVQALPDAVQLRFADDGVAFDPLAHPEPVPPRSLIEAQPGGLGLVLTRKSVSDAHYARRDGRNVLTLSVPRR